MRGLFEPVLDEQIQVVALIQDVAPDIWIQGRQPTDLAVLFGYELLVKSGDLDIDVELRQVEVGRKALGGVPVAVPLDIKGSRFVAPVDLIEVQ